MPFSVKKAHEAQLQLSRRIITEDRLPKKIRLVAGVDVAYAKGISIGAVTVLDYSSLKLIESRTVRCTTGFPYVPTLLSFREIRPAVLSIMKLKAQPDIFIVDGQGLAHPYRCGFASHLGLVINKPTIGVAKSRLFGEIEKMKTEDDLAFLVHQREIVGAMVRTRGRRKPLYISLGHLISLETAIKIVKHCVKDHYLPEPIFRAHSAATAEKRKINIA